MLAEEKSISKQLADWGSEDIKDEDARMRYDFLALTDERRLVVIEIKRSGHAVTLDDLQRLESYRDRLAKAHKKEIHMVMLCGGTLDVSEQTKQNWKNRRDGEIATWGDVYDKVRQYYEQYRAILEGDVSHPDFAKKVAEIAQAKEILEGGSVHRDSEARKQGLGPQDSNYSLGILGFGSLLDDPGTELAGLIEKRIDAVTPFKVEFARTSTYRDGAPTLVPVEQGGAEVKGAILLLKPGVTLKAANDILWRRETRQNGTTAQYDPKNPGDIEIRTVKDLVGVGEVLYAAPVVNLKPDAKELAELAIASAKGNAGAVKRDGINYLLNAKKNGIKTPLMDAYEKAILERTNQPDLEKAFEWLRKQAASA